MRIFGGISICSRNGRCYGNSETLNDTFVFDSVACNYAHTHIWVSLRFRDQKTTHTHTHSIHILANFRDEHQLTVCWSQALFYYVLLYATRDEFALDSENGNFVFRAITGVRQAVWAPTDIVDTKWMNEWEWERKQKMKSLLGFWWYYLWFSYYHMKGVTITHTHPSTFISNFHPFDLAISHKF